MEKAPKSLRLHIGLFGRTNVGKSSFLNLIAGQDVAVTSHMPGTTTDVVEKAMELLPVGPVLFLDTAGIDDSSALAGKRLKKTKAIFARADVFVLIVEPDIWTAYEDSILSEAKALCVPCIIVVNKTDMHAPGKTFLDACRQRTPFVMQCASTAYGSRDMFVKEFKFLLMTSVPEDAGEKPPLLADLIAKNSVVVLIVPIDKEAPKGRIILPQVQTVRDGLDNDAIVVVVKENGYRDCLVKLSCKPDLVVCDSQVVEKMVAETPTGVPCTTFSILFSRLKGDLAVQAEGLGVIDSLKEGDRILIAESCTHHAVEDDIGRVKIPRWLRRYTGLDLVIDVCSGRDFPKNLGEYKLVVLCGSCMLTRRETMARIRQAHAAGVAVTNYGLCISFLKGVIERVLEPFPSAYDAFRNAVADKGEAL
jgi:[FeFe] hydrogenase H-cluster maturation GTPase HydF